MPRRTSSPEALALHVGRRVPADALLFGAAPLPWPLLRNSLIAGGTAHLVPPMSEEKYCQFSQLVFKEPRLDSDTSFSSHLK